MYYEKKIRAGKTIEVYKSKKKQIKKFNTRETRKKITEEEMEKINEANAERKLRILINHNFKCGDFHLVLNYAKEKRPSAKQAQAKLKYFMDKLREAYRKEEQALKYIKITEYENSAIHHHIVINNPDGLNIMKMIRKIWKHGGTHFTPLDDTGNYRKLASYLIKETQKTYKKNKKEGGQKQRYTPSRNLVMPKTEYKKKDAKNWKEEPVIPKGYYLDKDSLYNGNCKFYGKYQKYILVQIGEENERKRRL